MAAIRWTEEQLRAFAMRRPSAAGGPAKAAGSAPPDAVPPPDGYEPDAPTAQALLEALCDVMATRKTSAYLLRHPDWRASEHTHQVLFFMALDAWTGQDPRRMALREDIIGTTNGGFLRPGQGGRLRHAGARRGVPDIEAWIPSRDADGTVLHGLFIEMKRPEIRDADGKRLKPPGRLSHEQDTRLCRLRSRGYRAETAFGVEHALRILGQYLEQAKTMERLVF